MFKIDEPLFDFMVLMPLKNHKSVCEGLVSLTKALFICFFRRRSLFVSSRHQALKFGHSVPPLKRKPFLIIDNYSQIKMIAPEYFENGDAAMETVCYQMDKWSLPCPGQTLQLPLLGSVLQVIYDTPNLFCH